MHYRKVAKVMHTRYREDAPFLSVVTQILKSNSNLITTLAASSDPPGKKFGKCIQDKIGVCITSRRK